MHRGFRRASMRDYRGAPVRKSPCTTLVQELVSGTMRPNKGNREIQSFKRHTAELVAHTSASRTFFCLDLSKHGGIWRRQVLAAQ